MDLNDFDSGLSVSSTQCLLGAPVDLTGPTHGSVALRPLDLGADNATRSDNLVAEKQGAAERNGER